MGSSRNREVSSKNYYKTWLHLERFIHFRINEVWRKGWSGTKVVHMYLPECEEGPKEYVIVLCLRNISYLESEMIIKRKQLCSCRLKEVKDTFNITKYVYTCPHRAIVTLEISNTKFYVSKAFSKFLRIFV